MTTYVKIKPSSIRIPYKEDYEFLLMWLSPSGGVRQWFFSSTEGAKVEKFKSSVIDTIADFRGVPNDIDPSLEMTAKSFSREEFDFVTSILESNRIIIVAKDSTEIPAAIQSATKKTDRIAKDYRLTFQLMLKEPDLMNV